MINRWNLKQLNYPLLVTSILFWLISFILLGFPSINVNLRNDVYLNADSLYHSYFYSDVIQNNFDTKNWLFPHSSLIFPEFTSYMIIKLFIKDILTINIINSIFTYFYSSLAIILFFFYFGKPNREKLIPFFLLHAIFNLLIGTYAFGLLYVYYLSPHYHVGTIGNTLIFAILFEVVTKRQKKLLPKIMLFLLAFIFTLSDALFIFYATVPIFFTSMLINFSHHTQNSSFQRAISGDSFTTIGTALKGILLKILRQYNEILVVLISISAFYVYFLALNVSRIVMMTDVTIPQIIKFLYTREILTTAKIPVFNCALFIAILLICGYVYIIQKLIRGKDLKNTNYIEAFGLAILPLNLWLLWNSIDDTITSIRFLAFPILYISIYIFYSISHTLKKSIVAILLLCGFCGLLIISRTYNFSSDFANSRQLQMSCISEELKHLNVEHGLSSYWYKVPYKLLTSEDILTETAATTYKGKDVLTNYIPLGSLDYSDGPFQFIITDKFLSPDIITKLYGQPDSNADCGENKIFVYKRGLYFNKNGFLSINSEVEVNNNYDQAEKPL